MRAAQGELLCQILLCHSERGQVPEFLKREQGNMTMEEYDQKFNVLSQFAPDLVRTEVERAKKFVKGLKSEI